MIVEFLLSLLSLFVAIFVVLLLTSAHLPVQSFLLLLLLLMSLLLVAVAGDPVQSMFRFFVTFAVHVRLLGKNVYTSQEFLET